MESISKLDDEYAHVARHCDEHLAHRRSLLCFARIELQSLEFREPVDDAGDLRSEPRLDVGQGDLGVLDCVMQERRDDRNFVESDIGDDFGDRKWMADVQLPAHA